MLRLAAALVCLGLLAGCLEDPMLDGGLFPCRDADDCIEGYVCHATRYVCVLEGTEDVDAGMTDAGVVDAGE